MSKKTTKTASTAEFSAQYKHPLWQKKRLKILERDGFACKQCGDKNSTLHVHHCFYEKGKKIWDYNDIDLFTLCDSCHLIIHDDLLSLDSTLKIIKRKSCIQKNVFGESFNVTFLNQFLSEILRVMNTPFIERDIVKIMLNLSNALESVSVFSYTLGKEEDVK